MKVRLKSSYETPSLDYLVHVLELLLKIVKNSMAITKTSLKTITFFSLLKHGLPNLD